MLKNKISNLRKEALEAIVKAENEESLEELRIQYLGRKSEFGLLMRELKNISPQERAEVGQLANEAKNAIEENLNAAKKKIVESSFDIESERIDVTIPSKKIKRGHLHPLTKIQNEIEDIFTSMGFEVADGPEVETEFYNFDALNIPKDHPSRDMQDTFWLKGQSEEKILLRTQTSAVQVRYMQKHQPPFRIIVPGRIYRNEATDSTHEHTFHQFEALVVGDDINVGNFKYIAQEFFSKFFKKDVEVRLRPSYFPFTEPSFEFDISCTVCGGKGCSACKNAGWLEIGGAGMVNQNVFVAAGYPRNRYQGFAWGFGVERLAMMKYKIDDIRLFHSGDIRFINQF
jgi:phenylalanyl-tRNA synthetase alpha chain